MPRKTSVTATLSIDRASCYVFSTSAIKCPLCQRNVPPNTEHECEKDGGITTVRELYVPDRSRGGSH
jgi:hypothetical protein